MGQLKNENLKYYRTKYKKAVPVFILYFISASLLTTLSSALGIPIEIFSPFKSLSKFFIVIAMVAIGLNTNILKLISNGPKPLLTGFLCWCSITLTALFLQYTLGLW